MYRGVKPVTPQKQPIPSEHHIDYSSVYKMDESMKKKVLRDPQLNPYKLTDPYDYLNAQMYRWTQLAKRVSEGHYTPEQKDLIAQQAYRRMILPYYLRTKQEPLSEEQWMKNAYGVGASFDLDRSYNGSLYNGGSHGTMSLMHDILQATRTFTNILGAVVSPPHPNTDEDWQQTMQRAKNNPGYKGFWAEVEDTAGHSYLPVKPVRNWIDTNSDKLEFLQHLRPNKDWTAKASSFVVEAVPFAIAASVSGGSSDAPSIAHALMGESRAGKLVASALDAARDGAIYGTFTRKFQDKEEALKDAIDWAVGSTILNVGGQSLGYVGGKIVNAASESFGKVFKRKADLVEAGRTMTSPEESDERFEEIESEDIARNGLIGQRSIDDAAAEHIIKMESSGMTPEQIRDHERAMVNGPNRRVDGPMLAAAIRLRTELAGVKLSEATPQTKARILANLTARSTTAAGRLTKNVAVLQEALYHRFTSLDPSTLNARVMQMLIKQVAPGMGEGAASKQLVAAAQDKWAQLVVEAGKDAETELTTDLVDKAWKAEQAKRAAMRDVPATEAVQSRTRRWKTPGGTSGVSYSFAPQWTVYAKNALKSRGKQWNSTEIAKWVNALDEDDFAADLHAYFLPEFLKAGNIRFEHGNTAEGPDHSNLYAFAWNYKDSMPKEYAARLEELYADAPKMSRFFQQTPKKDQAQLMRRISLAMWNHVDNFLGSGRFPRESNIFRSTQSDLMNPTVWQKDLFEERVEKEQKIIDKMYARDTPENRRASQTIKALFLARKRAFKAGNQDALRETSGAIASQIVSDSKGKYVDWGLE